MTGVTINFAAISDYLPCLSYKQRAAYLLSGIVLLLSLSYFLHFSAQFTDARKLNRELKKLSTQIKKHEKNLAQLNAQTQVKSMAAVELNTTDIELINQLANQADLQLEQLQPSPQQINIAARGSYAQLVKFCLALNQQTQLVISQFTINKAAAETLIITLLIKPAYQNKQLVTTPKFTDQLRDPFLSISSEISLALQHYALEQLRLVGVLTNTQEAYAIIAAPDGKYYWAKRGDIVATQQLKVWEIYSDRLQLLSKSGLQDMKLQP